MLKSFKLHKRDSAGLKSRITSADISSPTQSSPKISQHAQTLEILRTSSTSSSHTSNTTTATKLRNLSRSSTSSGPKDISSPLHVIKALKDYEAKSKKEVSFSMGEFFHVLDESSDYYEASNPATGTKGLVPKKYFKVFDRTRPSSRSATSVNSISRDSQHTKVRSLYAVVLYDFKAEKADELTAYAGEMLFICAYHDYEWFIAKPVGRLGGPGLVPVSYVSIIDITTGYATGNDVKDDIQASNLPTVQEWKKDIAKYKASNISLGEAGSSSMSSPSMTHSPMNTEFSILTASVDSFSLENDKYWFSVTCQLSDNKFRHLKRSYQDFYDLQVRLLDTFPAESGKLRDSSGNWGKRIMPYIPGPVPYVTESITKGRRADLDLYIRELLALPAHISQSQIVASLFELRDNNYDAEIAKDDTELNETIEAKQQTDTTTISAPIAATEQSPISNKTITEKSYQNIQDNILTGEDLKLFEKLSSLTLANSEPQSRPPSMAPPALVKPTKIKVYFKDDIFALLLNNTTTLKSLRSQISSRIGISDFKLHVKLSDAEGEEIKTDTEVYQVIQGKLRISVHEI